MAHEYDTGFTVRTASWHRQEEVRAEPPKDYAQAREWAGLNWEPEFRPYYFLDEDGTLVEDSDVRRVVRNDKPAREAGLGSVSSTFELVTIEEMGRIVEPVLEQPGCDIDVMMSLKGGRIVFVLIKLDEPYEIRGDIDGFGDQVVTLPYFGIMNGMAGESACKGQYTQIRWVCANTVQAGALEGDRHGAQFHLRHTSGVKTRIDDAREVVAGCRAEAARWRELAESLASYEVTDGQQVEFLDRFIPVPHADVVSERVRNNVENDRARFLHVLRESPTNCGMQHTALGLFNATVEFADHMRGFRNHDTYITRQVLRAEPMKAKALSLVRELVGAS